MILGMIGGMAPARDPDCPVTLALSGSSARISFGHSMRGKHTQRHQSRLSVQMLEVFRSIVNDLKDKTMTDHNYMKAGESLPEEEPDAFEGTPFDRISNVKHANSEESDLIIGEATKVFNAAKRNGSIGSDEDVYQSLALPNEFVKNEGFYAYKVGPVAATHDELEWTSAYRMNLEDAEHHKSDTFREAASELQIPDGLKLAPKFIISAYRILYEHTEETGRPIHPYKIRAEANVVLRESTYPHAFRYLNDLPGVEPPSDSDAWVYVDDESLAATEETHA
jgi:hypothetical protein